MELRYVGMIDVNGDIMTPDPEQQAQTLWAQHTEFWAEQLADPVTRAQNIVGRAWDTLAAYVLSPPRIRGFDEPDEAAYDDEPDGYCNSCPSAVWKEDLNEDGLCPDCEDYDRRRLLGTPNYQLDEEGLAKKEALIAPHGRCGAAIDGFDQSVGCDQPLGEYDAEFGTCARYPDCCADES